MESKRQHQYSRQIQKDLGEIFQRDTRHFFLDNLNFFLCLMLLLWTLFLHRLNEDGLRFFLITLITSDSFFPVFSFISSNVILSAQPAQIIQFSSLILDPLPK